MAVILTLILKIVLLFEAFSDFFFLFDKLFLDNYYSIFKAQMQSSPFFIATNSSVVLCEDAEWKNTKTEAVGLVLQGGAVLSLHMFVNMLWLCLQGMMGN